MGSVKVCLCPVQLPARALDTSSEERARAHATCNSLSAHARELWYRMAGNFRGTVRVLELILDLVTLPAGRSHEVYVMI